MATGSGQGHQISSPTWLEPVLLLLIVIVAAALRFWQLDSTPPGFHYDEALEALEAWRVLTRPDYHPVFFPGDFGLPAMFIYLDSAAFWLFGQAPQVARGVAAGVGTLTVLAVYVLGRELALADERIPSATPLLAAAALAGLRWHLTFSRVAIEGIQVGLFVTLILWTLMRGSRTGSGRAWLGLGVLLGLSLYTYPAAWLLPPMLVIFLAWVRLMSPHWLRGQGRSILLAAGVAALVAAPLLLHFVHHPEQMTLRSGQVSIIDTGQPLAANLSALGQNLLKVLGMFSIAGDTDPRSNVPGMPALDWLISIPFYLGVGLAVWRWKRPAYGVLLLAAGTLLSTTVLSQYAPNFRRSDGVTPLVAMFIGLGLAAILAWRPRGRVTAGLSLAVLQQRWRPQTWLVVGILLASTVLSIRTYFGRWGQMEALYYAYDQGLWEIGRYATSLPADEATYVSPRPASDATLAFAWREGPEVRHFDGRHAFIVPGDRAATSQDASYIIIEHEDYRGGLLRGDLFPDASEAMTFRDRGGQVYARVWRVPAGTRLARQPAHSASARWPGFELVGYDLIPETVSPGKRVYIQLWWQVNEPVEPDWTVFVHLLGPPGPDGNRLWAGKDSQPGQGSVPTTTWRPGELILDEYEIELPAAMPPGDYEIEVGLYDLAAERQRAVLIDPAGADHVVLGTVTVVAE